MESEIGMTAGKVYQFLSTSGSANRQQIKKGVKDAKSEIIDMALGWLAREGKLTFLEKDKKLLISLK